MKLPVLSSKQIEKALKKAGFVYGPKRGKGSHIAMVKIETSIKRLVIIPKRKNIPKGTLMAILEQAGLSKQEFLKLLD